jgi:hypothetical protein
MQDSMYSLPDVDPNNAGSSSGAASLRGLNEGELRTLKTSAPVDVRCAASAVAALVAGLLVGAMMSAGGPPPAACPAAAGPARTAGSDRVPQGWLVERLFHTEPVRCPWLADGAAADAACVRRVEELTAMRRKLATCEDPLRVTDKTYGHRGAALVAPEETLASFEVAAQSGAGFVECDASVTRDLQFVCRHGSCDLHTTTDIVANHPALHARCSRPFVPGSGVRPRLAMGD